RFRRASARRSGHTRIASSWGRSFKKAPRTRTGALLLSLGLSEYNTLYCRSIFIRGLSRPQQCGKTRPPAAMPTSDDDLRDPLYIASLGKAMRVLEAFRQARSPLGLTELARLTGLGKSAVQRFTYSWERLGYLVKD